MSNQITETTGEVDVMGTIISKVPDLAKERGWGAMELVRRGFAVNTSYRLLAGDTDVSMSTAKRLCEIFEVDELTDVFVYIKDGESTM
jgi:methyl coenzyme M reductase alpha subunit